MMADENRIEMERGLQAGGPIDACPPPIILTQGRPNIAAQAGGPRLWPVAAVCDHKPPLVRGRLGRGPPAEPSRRATPRRLLKFGAWLGGRARWGRKWTRRGARPLRPRSEAGGAAPPVK